MLREEYRAALAFLRGRRRMLRLVTVCFLAGGLAAAIAAWTAFGSDPALVTTLMEQVGELLDSKQIADEAGRLDADGPQRGDARRRIGRRPADGDSARRACRFPAAARRL